MLALALAVMPAVPSALAQDVAEPPERNESANQTGELEEPSEEDAAMSRTETTRPIRMPTYSSSKQGVIDVFDFRNTPLRDVLQVLSQLTGRNVVATPEIQELPISIYLREVKPMLALEVLAKNYN
ncbi:MAG: hypothetical protein ACOCWR_10555, partial [Oceanidesulfovibrio sp.]